MRKSVKGEGKKKSREAKAKVAPEAEMQEKRG